MGIIYGYSPNSDFLVLAMIAKQSFLYHCNQFAEAKYLGYQCLFISTIRTQTINFSLALSNAFRVLDAIIAHRVISSVPMVKFDIYYSKQLECTLGNPDTITRYQNMSVCKENVLTTFISPETFSSLNAITLIFPNHGQKQSILCARH